MNRSPWIMMVPLLATAAAVAQTGPLSDTAYRTGIAQESLRKSAGETREELARIRSEMQELFPDQATAIQAGFDRLDGLSAGEMQAAVGRLQAASREGTLAEQLQLLTQARSDQTAIESGLRDVAFQLASQKALADMSAALRETLRQQAVATAETKRLSKRTPDAARDRTAAIRQDQQKLAADAARLEKRLAELAAQAPPGAFRDALEKNLTLSADLQSAAEAIQKSGPAQAVPIQEKALENLTELVRATEPPDHAPELRRLEEARRTLNELVSRQDNITRTARQAETARINSDQDQAANRAAALEPFLPTLSPLAAQRLEEARRLMEAVSEETATGRTPDRTQVAEQAGTAGALLEAARQQVENQIARLQSPASATERAEARQQLAAGARELAASISENPASGASPGETQEAVARLADAALALAPEAAPPLVDAASRPSRPADRAELANVLKQAASQIEPSAMVPADPDPIQNTAHHLARAAAASATAREASAAGDAAGAREKVNEASAELRAARAAAAELSPSTPEIREALQSAASSFEAARQLAADGQNPVPPLLSAESDLARAQRKLSEDARRTANQPTAGRRLAETAKNLARAAVEAARAETELARSPNDPRPAAKALEETAQRLAESARLAAQAQAPLAVQSAIDEAAQAASRARAEAEHQNAPAAGSETQRAAAAIEDALARIDDATPEPPGQEAALAAVEEVARASTAAAESVQQSAKSKSDPSPTAGGLNEASQKAASAAQAAADASLPASVSSDLGEAARLLDSAAEAASHGKAGEADGLAREGARKAASAQKAASMAMAQDQAAQALDAAIEASSNASEQLAENSASAPADLAAAAEETAQAAAEATAASAPGQAARKAAAAAEALKAAAKAAGQGQSGEAASQAAEAGLKLAEARESMMPSGESRDSAEAAARVADRMSKAAQASAKAQLAMANAPEARGTNAAGELAGAAHLMEEALKEAEPTLRDDLAAAESGFAAAQKALQQGNTDAARAAATDAQQALAEAMAAQSAPSQGSTAPPASTASQGSQSPPSQASSETAKGSGLGETRGNMASSGDEGQQAQTSGGLDPRARDAAVQLKDVKPPPEFVPEVRQYFKNLADEVNPHQP